MNLGTVTPPLWVLVLVPVGLGEFSHRNVCAMLDRAEFNVPMPNVELGLASGASGLFRVQTLMVTNASSSGALEKPF